jgi:PII-like signaling protein
VNQDCLKLTTYFGERDRSGHQFVADALSEIYARHELQTSLVMRGVEGFGLGHHLRTDRLLSLSEDLPLVSVAVDTRARIEGALPDVQELRFGGLITLERARMLTGRVGAVVLPSDLHEAIKLTVYVGRYERADGRPAYRAVVETLRRHGLAGATVLLGVDGTAHGVRQRARFVGRNAQVPLMIIAIGDGRRVARTLPELGRTLAHPLITLERVRICKRAGERLAEPSQLPDSDASGLGVWQKLMVHAGQAARFGEHSLHDQLVRSLREAGAAGATSLRGIWGYQADEAPRGDSLWHLRRRVPVVTVILDTPQRIRQWFTVVDRVTAETGLVTSEIVPAFRARARGQERGGLRLAEPGLPT